MSRRNPPAYLEREQSHGLTVDGMGLEEYRAIHGAAADREAARMLAEARIRCGATLPERDPGDEDDAPIARRHWGAP